MKERQNGSEGSSCDLEVEDMVTPDSMAFSGYAFGFGPGSKKSDMLRKIRSTKRET